MEYVIIAGISIAFIPIWAFISHLIVIAVLFILGKNIKENINSYVFPAVIFTINTAVNSFFVYKEMGNQYVIVLLGLLISWICLYWIYSTIKFRGEGKIYYFFVPLVFFWSWITMYLVANLMFSSAF